MGAFAELEEGHVRVKVLFEMLPKTAKKHLDRFTYAMAIINTIKELLTLNPLYSEELRQFFNRFHPNDPSPLTDFAAALTTASKEDLQDVIEAVPLLPRMQKTIVLIKKEVEVFMNGVCI